MSDENLEDQVKRIRHILEGNGNDGLIKEHERVMRDLYRDSRTGEPGLVAESRQMRASIDALRKDYNDDRSYVQGAVKTIVALFSIGAVSSVVALVYNIATG